MLLKKLFVILLILISSSIIANNVKITSDPVFIDINDVLLTAGISFSLSWENSWRTDITGAGYAEPYNHDAVWIFMKYKINDTEHPNHPNEPWHHATLRASGHSVPVNATLSLPSDKKGVFIYRSSNGFGEFNVDDIELRWDYGFDGLDEIPDVSIRVFAIEMVNIPEGAFYVGNDGLTGDIRGQFYRIMNDLGDYSNPYLIDSENSIVLGGVVEGSLGARTDGLSVADGFDSANELILPAAFPKGYDAYYIMKHSITQKQYVDFLNTLTRRQQKKRTYLHLPGYNPANVYAMTNSSTVIAGHGDSPDESWRNGIRFDPTNFFDNLDSDPPLYFFCDLNENGVPNEEDDGLDLYCNFLSSDAAAEADDVSAYLDWAALRPFTELEYEKAARGIGQPAGLDIWAGGDLYTNANRLVPLDVTEYENGNMAFDYLVNRNYSDEGVADLTHNCAFGLSGRKYGPTRAGIFARDITTRLESGASYFGVMDLSGNLWELTVSVSQVISLGHDVPIDNYTYTGTHGDGELAANGDANQPTWPLHLGHRGGGFGFNQRFIRISDRTNVNSSFGSRSGVTTGLRSHGGRGVRTAP